MEHQGTSHPSGLDHPHLLLLGLQHMFAMFGATVLVPALTGLSVSTTLFFSGVGTLLFHFFTRGKVPAFLGSSFAFLSGYQVIAPMLTNRDGGLIPNTNLLPYACFGVALAGLLYVALAFLIKIFHVSRVMRYFPPIVTGPVIISIGLTLSSSAISHSETNWPIAIVAVSTVIISHIWGRGMFPILSILLGVAVSFSLVSLGQWMGMDFMDPAKLQALRQAPWFGIPIQFDDTLIALFNRHRLDSGLLVTAGVTMMPIALATIVEHIGDICAISSTCQKNYLNDPGLHRTLLGDGIATTFASIFGAPANTTYGENTGVLALSQIHDPKVVQIAAVFSILVSFCPKFAFLIAAMPASIFGGVSLILYGMIAVVGIRNMIENQVDLSQSRNIIIVVLILVLAIGGTYSGPLVVSFGHTVVRVSALSLASIVGILLNILLPDATASHSQTPPVSAPSPVLDKRPSPGGRGHLDQFPEEDSP